MSTVAMTPPRLARESWAQHRNYPEQLLLLGSHAGFRRESQDLLRRARASEDLYGIGSRFLYWLSFMRSHESYEEHKLYPYLEHRYSTSLGSLRDGHAELHEAEASVREALADGEGLADALSRHDEVLDRHLRLEEDAVIPMLLELDRAEFERYSRLPIDMLLP